MKAALILLLSACGVVNAEMAPIVDTSMNPTAEVSAKPAAPNALFEVMGRLEQLQVEVQQLTGQVEEQANLIAEMKKSQATMYSDMDARLQGLEKKPEGVKPPAGAENLPVQDGSIQPDTKSVEATVSAPVAAPEAKQAPTQKTEITPSSADEKQKYQLAYEALRNGHTAQAITEFTSLLSNNPKGEFANNAQYWLGEAHRVNQDTDSARKAFNSVIVNYPGSAKVPDALLKLGIIETEQKNTQKAREYLTRVTVDFPTSTAARLAAKKLLLLDDVKQ